MGVEDRFGIVENYEDLLGGKEGSEGSQIIWILDACTDDLGEPCEKVGTRRRELIATYKSAVVAKPVLDSVVMEDGESN